MFKHGSPQISPLQSSSLKAIWNSGNGEDESAARAPDHVCIYCDSFYAIFSYKAQEIKFPTPRVPMSCMVIHVH